MNHSLFEGISSLQDWSQQWLAQQGLAEGWTTFAAIVMNIVILFGICVFFYAAVRFIIRFLVRSYTKKTKDRYDNILIKKNAFAPLAHFIPGLLIYHFTPVFFNIEAQIIGIVRTLAVLYIIVMLVVMIIRVLRSLEYIGLHSEKYKKKPVSSFIQMCILTVYIICAILILSILIGQSPLTVFAGFGASMAIILLIFKDTILGLVASVQLAVNDMVRLGDWITVPNYNADGDLIEINLMTVKIRNWDKTVTNVPTYVLISNGFKNWREMQDMNIRRIKQNLLFDISSIKEIDDTFVRHLQEKKLFNESIEDIQWHDENGYQPGKMTTVTNLGLFRRYVESYLDSHPGVSDIYVVVRHLQQTATGLPLQVYAFSKDVSFKPLQALQADIFEHLFAIVDEFDLVIFQSPEGDDIRRIASPENGPFDQREGKSST